jgi:hypothetical protein
LCKIAELEDFAKKDLVFPAACAIVLSGKDYYFFCLNVVRSAARESLAVFCFQRQIAKCSRQPGSRFFTLEALLLAYDE